jgi:signal transduction histidine kinase
MREEAFLRAHPGRLWIALLPPLAGCLVLTVAAALGASTLPVIPFALAGLVLAFGLGALLARELPGRRRRESLALQLEAVSIVIGKAGSSLELQEVLDAVTRSTTEVTGVRGCSIKLLDPGGKTMSVRSLAGLRREVSELRAETAESIATRSLMEGRPVLVEGPVLGDFPELDSGTESLICVPLRHEGRVIGALCVYGEIGTKLSPEMLSFLSRLGDLAVLSIVHASVYESLKKLDEAKSWFLRKAAHELVSPLGVIQSMAQNLLQDYLGDLTDRQKEEIERMRARAAELSEVVGDLLALARGRAQPAATAPGGIAESVDLCAALADTVKFFQPAARERMIDLAITAPCEPCPVPGSLEGVKSVLGNLLSNAIKYSAPHGKVSVSLVRGVAGALLVVSDQGIGIPAAEQARLFSEFFRASNARSFTESGTGLGLAVVKAEVDAMRGTLDIQSEEGKGTTVRVLLPGSR